MKRLIFALASSVALFPVSSSAETVGRDPAMDSFGPTVVQETLDKTQVGSFSWELTYIGDIGRNFAGGHQVGNAYAGLGAARGYFDLDKALGWKGSHFFVHLQGMHGSVPSSVTGDAQVASNIESYANTIRLMEAWYKHAFNEKVEVLFGLMDLNAEFYMTESSLFFLNSSFGLGTELAQLGPDGRTASTFPVTSLAGKLKYTPTTSFYIDTAIFDAMPGEMESTGTKIKIDSEKEGYLLISEAGWTPEDSKLAIGAWTYTKAYDHIYDQNSDGDPKSSRNYGAYVMGEHHLSKSLAAFARYGMAAESVNRFKDNLAIGISATGLFPGREEDQLGLGVTQVTNSEGYEKLSKKEGQKVESTETVIELTYRYKVSKNVYLQPDLQYIINPGTNPSFTNALTGFLRFQIEFDK